ncbi:zinc-ribbon domain-containing protein [Pseudarthrobacter sp. AB1]|uniref:zinc-ribbon domain-containing protein n=1 Tax=Pseudarthrobacter sp. AB1 TaxID=2138309 RepID=UPI001D03AC90|nr:zinc-ribbon domain-containing protein [Pseudarthrobacter sp. AB1]
MEQGGLKAIEPFPGRDAWWLTECLKCGVSAHYKFTYVTDKNAEKEKTCRACHWKEWAAYARKLNPPDAFEVMLRTILRAGKPVMILHLLPEPEGQQFLDAHWWPGERLKAHLDRHGYDFISNTVEFNDGMDPVVGKCRRCGRITAQRLSDYGWGCTCKQNKRSTTPGAKTSGRQLLVDSDSPALSWWDHENNDEAAFQTVTLKATRACNWRCPSCGHRFPEKVNEMTAQRPSCPVCAAARRAQWNEEYERWKVTPVADVPELAAAWVDGDDPSQVMVVGSSHRPLRKFRCPQGHACSLVPLTFLQSGCPSCKAAETRKAKRSMVADILPEIASQWHPTRNGKLAPQTVFWDSKRTIWWVADCCGHEWGATPRDRDKYDRLRCPRCETKLGSLAWQDPGLAAEWSDANPVTAWEVRSYGKTDFVPEWICAINNAHVWPSSLAGRSNGSGCPECKKVGKSKVELAHHAAAEAAFSGARSGAILRDSVFQTRKSWSADISAVVGGHTLVIEYDGAYWHRPPAKVLVDEYKTRDLLAAGYLVVRLREDDLIPLDIQHPNYGEVRVYSAAPKPHDVMMKIQEWLVPLVSAT